MRIFHRIADIPTAAKCKALQTVGVDFRETSELDVQVVCIDDDDPRWPNIERVAREFIVSYNTYTQFSRNELLSAHYLDVEPQWQYGYPQPEDDYRRVTYDDSDYCTECGTNLRQVAPFSMRKEPAWGRRSLMQLNWIFGEYFVETDAYNGVFKPFGIPYRPVLKYKSNSELSTVVQLDISQSVELDLEGRPYETCPVCLRRKYSRAIIGYYPKPKSKPDSHIFRSKEWFGSGHSASNRIIISNDLYREIDKAGLRGAEFKACAS